MWNHSVPDQKKRVVMASRLFVNITKNLRHQFFKKIDGCEKWAHETEIWQWQCLTGVNKKKQGPAIYLSLDDKIRKTCSNIQVKDLNIDDGIDILITKSKSLFAKDKSSGIPCL